MEKNSLAYRLNDCLMEAVTRFAECCDQPVDIEVIIGAANIFITGLLVNAPTRVAALETLQMCHSFQRDLLKATPNNFFGRGLQQNPNLN